jgi:hypothetical protein
VNDLVALIVDESKWLTFSLVVALSTSLGRAFVFRSSEAPARDRILAAMHLFFGMTIGVMAFGHLLAVSVKLFTGTLQGPVGLFYLIGIVLAVPSWWLSAHAWELGRLVRRADRRTIILNVSTAAGLLILGVHNLPLAAPALLNAAYQWNRRPAVARVIVGAIVVLAAGLLAGSLVFFISGQTFEEFSGME